MANEDQDVLESSDWIMDRNTGRESPEGEPDQEKTIAERVSLVANAEYEIGRAQIALKNGATQFDKPSLEFTDIETAIDTLNRSAEYHASQIEERELSAAVAGGEVSDAEAAMVLTYRAEAAKTRGLQMTDSYYDELESRLEHDADAGETEEQNQTTDEGQER